ncbi:MAG: hypothetical protein J0M04_08430 [Verrucomicrobia bacterium]|nr:hypothetical protein [Verrucomicrobiota bacterium]
MSTTSPLLRNLCLTVLASVACHSTLHATTAIHSDGFTASNQPLPGKPNYGSNVAATGTNWTASMGSTGVTGTPNIQLVWDGEGGGGNSGANGGLDTYISWNGRGNVVQLDGTGTGGTANTYISFVPSAAVAAKITSFDLDAWSGWPAGGNMTVEWTIRNATKAGTVLATGSWTRTTGGRDTVSPAFTGAPGQTVVLQLTRTAGNGDYLAMDNLVFDEITNIPSIVSFASSALIADGNPISLDWEIGNIAGASSLTLDDGNGPVNALPLTDSQTGFGGTTVTPAANTTYTLTLNGTSSTQVTILSGSTVSLTSNARVAAAPNHEVTLTWQVLPPNAALVTVSDGTTVHNVTADTDSGTGIGSRIFTVPSASTVFTLEANGSGVTRTVRVLRQESSSADFSVNAATIPVGSPVTVAWANAAGGATDWIGIYRTTDIPQLQVSTQWNYLNGTRTSGGSVPAGSMSFSTLPVGDYYACLLLNDGYEIAQGPVLFSVVNPPPEPEIIRMVDVRRNGSQFTLEWASKTDHVYDIYASDSLDGDPLQDWTRIADDITAEGDGTTSHTEDLGATPPPRRFYKVYEYAATLP